MGAFLRAQSRNGRVIRLPVVPDPHAPPRPVTRADCVDGPRPCPWVGCRHHLGADVTHAGGLALRFHDDPSELQHSCVLDVAATGPKTEAEMAEILGVSTQRIRQIEYVALKKFQRAKGARELAEP